MKPIDFILIAVILLILVAAGWFVYRSKKSGKKCIGCPNSGDCASCNYRCDGKV